MRILGRLFLGLVIVGLVAGWLLRPKVPRRRLPLLMALTFLPAPLHAAATIAWGVSIGLGALVLVAYGVACVATAAGAWWWLRATAPRRPFVAPLAVPAQAFVQVAATSVLGQAAQAIGEAVDVVPGIALLGVAVALAAALVALLPTREHFPRLGVPGGGAASALGRAFARVFGALFGRR